MSPMGANFTSEKWSGGGGATRLVLASLHASATAAAAPTTNIVAREIVADSDAVAAARASPGRVGTGLLLGAERIACSPFVPLEDTADGAAIRHRPLHGSVPAWCAGSERGVSC